MSLINKIMAASSTLCVGLAFYGAYRVGQESMLPKMDEVNVIKEKLKIEDPKTYITLDDAAKQTSVPEDFWRLKCDSIIKAQDSIRNTKAGYELGRQSVKISESDSLRIAQRAYALGVQAVKDSLIKVGKNIK